MKTTVASPMQAFALIALGLAIAAMGIYVAEADDAPGAAAMGGLLMVAGVMLGVKAARNRLPRWAARTALAIGIVVAAWAAFLTHAVAVAAPLFPPSRNLPSAADPAPAAQYAAAVERARGLVRAAVLEQNLPGASVAVAAGGSLVWAEGFGWRDVTTGSPITPVTRFNVGTAAAAMRPFVASLRLSNTGIEPAAEWSPGHIGEPEEDPPFFTLAHDLIFRPLGLSAPAQPLPGDRATFYVPRAGNDPRRGRRLMYMRHLACCADGMAFYSTPSDVVRFALATDATSVNGELAGGMVMSLWSARDRGIVVVVASNIAYADTASMAQRISEAFAAP